MCEPVVLMGDGDIRDRWLRQALQRRTSSERTWILWLGKGDVIRMEIAGSSMCVYRQGIRVHIEHNVHPGNWISWLRMTWSGMRLPWSIFLNSKCLLMTYLEPDISSPSLNPKGSLMGIISEAASSALFETHLKHPHGLWRAIARWNNSEDKSISLKDFFVSLSGLVWSWFMFAMYTSF